MAKIKKSDTDELLIARKELAVEKREKIKLAAELSIAREELAFQKEEKGKRAAELGIANIELAYQDKEKGKRAAELGIANIELAFQDEEKGKRAAELGIANKEKVDRAAELGIANKEKGKRAAELGIANKELAFQNKEKEKRAAELGIANKELIYQDKEKGKRAAELGIANKEKEKREIANKELEAFSDSLKLASKYARSLIEASLDPLVTINSEGKITDMNEALVKITGITREKLTSTDFFEYFTEPQKAREVYQEVFAKGSVTDSPLTLHHKNGKLVDVLFNGSVYKDDSGKVLGVVIVARDITERNKSDEHIKHLANIVEYSDDAIVSKTLDGTIKSWNRGAEKMFGYSLKEVLGKNITIIVPPEFLDEEKNILARIKNDEIIDHYETTRVKKNKENIFVSLTVSPLKNNAGKIIGISKIARDVTSQKMLSEYSHSLIEATLDPLFTISPEGKITDMNEATVKVTCVSRENLIGSDFIDYFTEPDRARECYQKVFAKGFVVDYPLVIHDGKPMDVLCNGSVYKDARGNILGVVIVARDVTTQKQASQYARSLIEASLDPLVTISAAGKITDVNKASIEVTGVLRDNLIGTDFSNYFTEPGKAQEGYRQVFEKGFVADYPLTIKHKNGKLTDVLYNASVYKNDKGDVLGVFAAARDVTDQKRIEKELIEAKVFAELATGIAEEAQGKAESATRIAEDAVKAKQQFLSNMSHEIRTPMNAIIGFTKVVLKTELTVKQTEYLSAIKTSGDALIVLINDILDLAKVDAGKMTFVQTPFKMAASISAMLHLFETKIQEKNLELVKEYDKNIPEVLVGDPVRLHQIILNLVSNAVKFTTRGKITVGVRLLAEDEEKVTISFAVSDTGIGIPENKMENIFENFQQATSGTSRLYGGTGLGLAIVKQLVEPQGGTIRVESKINEGSTFSFTLNFLKTNAEADLETGITELDPEIKNIKVLVVEDIALNQLLMKTLLDDFGFERDIAANGKIAIEKLQAKSYDIILMDLQMPEMNGFEATEYIRTIMKSKIPIIALTADVTTVDLAKCKAIGMNDYIAKPVDERLLYSKIVGLVKKPVPVKNNGHKLAEVNAGKKSKYTNLDYLMHRTKSNPALMMEMISLYLDQTPALVNIMKQSLQDKDWHALYSAVHKMIPSFLIMGISTDFENMAKKIQEFASTQQQSVGIADMVSQLETVCTQACVELKEEFNTIKNTKA